VKTLVEESSLRLSFHYPARISWCWLKPRGRSNNSNLPRRAFGRTLKRRLSGTRQRRIYSDSYRWPSATYAWRVRSNLAVGNEALTSKAVNLSALCKTVVTRCSAVILARRGWSCCFLSARSAKRNQPAGERQMGSSTGRLVLHDVTEKTRAMYAGVVREWILPGSWVNCR